MSNSIRNMLVIIASFLLGGGVIFVGEALIHSYHPFYVEGSSAGEVVVKLPDGILALVLLTHAMGAFASGWFLKKFVLSADSFIITLVGLGWTLVGVAAMVKSSQPIWFTISDICVYLPMTILGSKLIKSKP